MTAAPPPGWALVTGASAGIGAVVARRLAARGHPVLLVARSADRLQALARAVTAAHGVEARVLVADLAGEPGLADCRAAVEALPGPVAVAVLNAGFGSRGAVWTLPRAREADMTRLNCVAIVDLAACVLPGMVGRGRGVVMVVASAAGAQPVPYMATYAATKAFELSWVRALAGELRGTGVRAIALCPGPVRTGFHRAAHGGDMPRWIPAEAPERTVDRAMAALDGRRVVVPTGPVARLTMPLVRLAPTALVTRVAAALHRPPGRRGGRALKGPGAPS